MNTEIIETDFRQKLTEMLELKICNAVWCYECDGLINLSIPNQHYCYYEDTGLYLCKECDAMYDEEEEDEDAEFGKPNRNKDCSACNKLIVGKYEFTGGQYADNNEPLCRICWDKPQHNCFNSCYKNPNGIWWCQE